MALTKAGDSQVFSYVGDIQTLTITVDGVYKMECLGAGGGEGDQAGGAGGKSTGHAFLEAGTVLYLGVGGKGGGSTGGFNGGGASEHEHCGAGGGASHVALRDGTLASIGAANISKILIVAGGGGGGGSDSVGGNGGGLSGGSKDGTGGTQSAGGAGGFPSNGFPGSAGTFGKGGFGGDANYEGASGYDKAGGGGGGGLYGGGGGGSNYWTSGAGGGGSGYIAGVPTVVYGGVSYTSSTAAGGGSASATDGKITITLVAQYEPSNLDVLQNNASVASVFAGTSVTFSLSNPNNEALSVLSHTITIKFGNFSQTQTLPANSSVIDYTFDISIIEQIPTAASGKCYITTQTQKDGTLIGSSNKTLTIKVPSDIVPVPGVISIERIDNTIPADWGIYVQTKSGVRIQVSGAEGVYGSSISSYKYVVGSETATSSDSTRSHSPISDSGNVNVSVVVTDTRGRSATTNAITINVFPYQLPYVSDAAVIRVLADGTEEDFATYAKATCTAVHSPCNGNNTFTVNLSYRPYGGTTWTPISVFTTADISVQFGDGKIDTDFDYEVQFHIQDVFGYTEKTIVLNSSFFTMHFKAGGHGVSFGCPAKIEDAVVISEDWKLYHGNEDFFSALDNRFEGLDAFFADISHEHTDLMKKSNFALDDTILTITTGDSADGSDSMSPETAAAIAEVRNTLNSYITSNDTALANEISRATDAEQRLSDKIGVVPSGKTLVQMIEESGGSYDDSEIKASVQNNAEEISTIKTSLTTLQTKIGDIPEGSSATTIVAYIGEVIISLNAAIERISALEEKAHEHENKDILDNITSEKITSWDSAEQNAKDYADSLALSGDGSGVLHAIAKSGNINDLEQTDGDLLIINGGTPDTVL